MRLEVRNANDASRFLGTIDVDGRLVRAGAQIAFNTVKLKVDWLLVDEEEYLALKADDVAVEALEQIPTFQSWR